MSTPMKTLARFRRGAVGCLAVAAGVLLLGAPSAFAVSKTILTGSIAGSGTNALSNPTGVAVDNSTSSSAHDLYVTDPADARVEKFTASGEFVLMFGKEVNETTGGNICTAASGNTCKVGVQGSGPGEFLTPTFVAVDGSSGPSAGDVYVGDTGDNVVSKFDSSGKLIASWGSGGQISGFGSLYGIAVDPSGHLFVLGESTSWYEESGSLHSTFAYPRGSSPAGLAVDAEENLYKVDGSPEVTKFTNTGESLGEPDTGGTSTGLGIDPATNDLYVVEGGSHVNRFALNCGQGCTPLESFGGTDLSGAQAIAVDGGSGVKYVADTGNGRVAAFESIQLPEVTAGPLTNVNPTGGTLTGHVDPSGAGPVTSCAFEYGLTSAYGSTVPCSPDPAASPPGSHFTEPTDVTADIAGLNPRTTYHFRLVAGNAQGSNPSADQTFFIPLPPTVTAESVSDVHADAASVHAAVNPGGGDTTYVLEYVDDEQFEASEFADASQSQRFDAGSGELPKSVTIAASGLKAGTRYHYRVVATNLIETVSGPTRTFTTLPFIPPINDACANAHVRQQTTAAQLLDCRAYELVSAPDTGGYDVESSLIPGQAPFGGYPEAEGRVLYGVHNGGIPGTGSPTNRGVDPYVATRGENGWSTKYVGIPADGTPSAAPFSSTLIGAGAGLEAFAFGGPSICSPCFENGDTGEPVRLPGGSLVQGMAGSEEPGPSAKASEVVAKPLSADGSHFVFASTSRFEPDGNSNGDISIYDRNLSTGVTHVVSKTPGEATMTGAGISELDISRDGSHVLIGQRVSEAEGDAHYHLYMNVGDSSRTVDLTPGTTSGVLYAGMSADGSEVFFTTKDRLLGEDEDASADLYAASISGQSATLSLLSEGSGVTGNTDVCNPAANSAHQHWNTKGAEANCGVVAIGGGGGVASQAGSVYFLSPERLDGSSNGTQDAPNLYLAHAGEAPRYVTTLESALNLPHPPALKRSFDHSFGSFDTAAGLAVDHSDGSVYAINAPTEAQAEAGAKAYVEKFDSSGNLVASFGDTTPAHNGRLAGSETPAGSFAPNTNFPPGQLAVDDDPDSPSYRDLYVPDFGNGVVDKFGPEGQYKGQVEASLATGVAVDSANGNLYVSQIFSFTHGSAYVSVFTPEGVEVPSAGFGVNALTPDAVAVDPTTKFVYLDQGGGEEAEVELYTPAGLGLRVVDPNPAHSLSIDPATGDLYADEGNQVARYDSSGNRLGTIGSGTLHGSEGVTIDPEGSLYASNGAGVAAFTPSLAPDPRVDNPAVVDAVSEPSARRTADFQVTPDGSYAAFDSTLALGGGEEDTAGHSEVYRYRSGDDNLDCVSCTSTGAASAGDSSLAQNGLSLLSDGRVFFDSTDQLVSADTDGKKDVYEVADLGAGNCSTASPAYAKATGSCIALISAGTSPFDSGLLTVSTSGKDAFFFTRDSLAPQDENGSTMKVYDAREGGGFPFSPQAVSCQASDECHGAASPAPGPVQVGSVAGTPGNEVAEKHKKHHKKKRHGKHRRHHSKASHKRGGAK